MGQEGERLMRAFIFPGQGSEYACMLKELYEQSSFASNFIDGLNLSFDIKSIYVAESDRIHDTRYSQPGNFVFGYILSELLRQKGITPDACAGLSLGEYTALGSTDSIRPKGALRILEKRAELMYEALKDKDTGMQAIMFMEREALEDAVSKFDKVWISNYNSPDQIVIAGDNKQLDECAALCLEKGAKKAVRLSVTGAFHTPLLKDASGKLAEELDGYEILKPSAAMYFNCTGNRSDTDVRTLLVRQLYSPVRFEEIVKNMLTDGINEFITIGAGRSVDGFIRSTALKKNEKVKISHIEKISDLLSI